MSRLDEILREVEEEIAYAAYCDRMAMEEAMVEDSDRSRAVVGVADPQRL